MYPTTDEHVQLIKGLNEEVSLVDFWSPGYPSQVHIDGPVDIRVPKRELTSLKYTMKNAGINFEIKIKDLQELIDSQEKSSPKGILDGDYDYNKYHDYDEINQWTFDMAAQNPGVISRSVLGESFEKRDIPMLTISRNLNNPAILVDCGFHAREWISPAFCQCYVNSLINDDILNSLTVYVIPVVNVDGYAYSWSNDRMWRKTRSTNNICIGVDPNRNCDIGFTGEGSSSQPCSDVYRGPHAESEPEVKALTQFMRDNVNNLFAYITFHAYGQMILYPFSYTEEMAATADVLDKYAVQAKNAILEPYRTRYIYGPGATTIYIASGGSDDYAYVTGIKLSYTVELRDKGVNGFILPESQIPEVCVETYELMKVMHQAALEQAA